MFDINTIINAAIAAAVNDRITEVLQQHANVVAALEQRIAALENNPAIGVDTTLAARVDALEKTGTPATITADAFVTYLDQQEWFWEKLTRKAGEAAQTVVDEAISDHTNEYDHDEYDEAVSALDGVDLSEIVTPDMLTDAVKEIIDDASFEVRVSL